MQHFYDGQIRRYLTQIIRLMSNFSYKDGNGNLRQVPVMYGDMTRQVANIIRDNSENKIPSVPRMSVYITGLEMDRDRLSDATFVSKLNIRERAFDENNQEYLNYQGKNYTVERLMPTPYKLTVNVDLWSSNTEQKLQIFEQILMLFNPSLEIQTTDNYIDWTSLSVVDLDNVQFSTRSIPVGTESEIDVGQLTFSTPIYISPPVKVKRLGVIQSIITSIFNEDTGDIDLGQAVPQQDAFYDIPKAVATSQTTTTKVNQDGTVDIDTSHNNISKAKAASVVNVTYRDYGIYIMNDVAQIVDKGTVGQVNWRVVLDALPGTYTSGLSTIRLQRDNNLTDDGLEIIGTITLNPLDETLLNITFDGDTLPTDDVITGPVVSSGNVDYVIDPQRFDPTQAKSNGLRLLLLGQVTKANVWKNTDGSLLNANENDIVEWDGNTWHVIFDSQNVDSTKYVTNLNTNIQYRWTGLEWVLSYFGEYPQGTWNIVLNS